MHEDLLVAVAALEQILVQSGHKGDASKLEADDLLAFPVVVHAEQCLVRDAVSSETFAEGFHRVLGVARVRCLGIKKKYCMYCMHTYVI